MVLPVGVGLERMGLHVNCTYWIIVGFFVMLAAYPRESVALNTKLFVDTPGKSLILFDVAVLLTSLDDIEAEFFAVAEIVHLAVDLYLINAALFPVRETVDEFVSITVPDTVGAHTDDAAVTVNVHVLVPITVLPL